jgi:hypothetical protein
MILRNRSISAEEIAEATGLFPVIMANVLSKVETAGQLNRHFANKLLLKLLIFIHLKKNFL